ADHRGVEAEAVGHLEHLTLRNADPRTGAVIGRVAVRYHGVQAVVAARQLEHDEDAIGMTLEAGALQGLGGERRRRPAEDDRQSGPETDAVQPARQKVTTRTAA